MEWSFQSVPPQARDSGLDPITWFDHFASLVSTARPTGYPSGRVVKKIISLNSLFAFQLVLNKLHGIIEHLSQMIAST